MLTVSCSTGQPGDTTLTFAGELDAASADQAYRYVHDTIDDRGRPVMLDVAGLSFCDARGLGALLRMSSHARQAGSFLSLLTPPRGSSGSSGSPAWTRSCRCTAGSGPGK
jgi:anti-anti-sigma factor